MTPSSLHSFSNRLLEEQLEYCSMVNEDVFFVERGVIII